MSRHQMTDQEIIQGLIARDNRLTEEFFFVKCRPLFLSIIQKIFNYEVDYDEFVNELYLYIMDDDAAKLRTFEYRSSVYQWLKILSIRFFIKKRNIMIEDRAKDAPYDRSGTTPNADTTARIDIEQLLNDMPNKRYAQVLTKLIIDDCEPEQLAQEMNITTANLYNIKKRAMALLTRTALKDIREYGR